LPIRQKLPVRSLKPGKDNAIQGRGRADHPKKKAALQAFGDMTILVCLLQKQAALRQNPITAVRVRNPPTPVGRSVFANTD
jgi:hypothetical protein